MTIDQNSLFLAAGICALAIAVAMGNAWLQSRSDRFLISWMFGIALLGLGVLLSTAVAPDVMSLMALAYAMEIFGFGLVFIASRQFTGRSISVALAGLMLACITLPVTLPILLGFDGLGLIVFNFLAAGLLAATGTQFWSARNEAPSSIAVMTTLYGATALSFFACGTILAHEGDLVLHRWPDNWAEQFNAIMCITGITGIGAISLGLNNQRAARRHHLEARTDILTGLLNRRALFDSFAVQTLREGDAVVAFDLDHFKAINDRHGHSTGDEVLRLFADALRQNERSIDIVARTGGEEFVLIMRDASMQLATSTAERIRAIFADSHVDTITGPLHSTASAGIALTKPSGEGFETVLHRADTALYRAKNGGRNRVVTELQAVA
jgi:diguanylate cyclase (GGDEF)-like protein